MSPAPADFADAEAAGIISQEQAQALRDFYAARPSPGAPAIFDAAHMLWYAGALVVMGAMGLFSTLAFGMLGGPALTITAFAYAAAFIVVGHHLRGARALPIPGGLFIACAVAMTPLAVYGLQESWGWWGERRPGIHRDLFFWVRYGWVPMELATLAAAALALRLTRFGFIALIAAVALWFLSIDIGAWAVGSDIGTVSDWNTRRTISLWFGLGLIAFAWAVDLRQRQADYAFWLHLAATLTFWGALTWRYSDSEMATALYALLNVGLLGLAVFLSRRVYAVFGVIGVALYLGHLAERVFKESLLFPFALSLIGVGLIGLGILYQRNAAAIGSAVGRALSAPLRRLRPAPPRRP
jgi:hypothetical protein